MPHMCILCVLSSPCGLLPALTCLLRSPPYRPQGTSARSGAGLESTRAIANIVLLIPLRGISRASPKCCRACTGCGCLSAWLGRLSQAPRAGPLHLPLTPSLGHKTEQALRWDPLKSLLDWVEAAPCLWGAAPQVRPSPGGLCPLVAHLFLAPPVVPSPGHCLGGSGCPAPPAAWHRHLPTRLLPPGLSHAWVSACTCALGSLL